MEMSTPSGLSPSNQCWMIIGVGGSAVKTSRRHLASYSSSYVPTDVPSDVHSVIFPMFLPVPPQALDHAQRRSPTSPFLLRLLTMPNGERIQFANNINFIFECHSLAFASPATVSRCGMIFLSDEAVDVDRMLKKWLQTHSASDQSETLLGVGGISLVR